MTFYDDEEIEENENLEEYQSEENELEEAEQDENNEGSNEVGAEDQYDGIDNLSSKGTMGSSRQRHGSRQRQINKARNMVNKGKNIAQKGKQVGKKAAEEGAKKAAVATTKAGAKAGSNVASAGARVAGTAMGPYCGGCLVIAIIIFLLIGIVGFFQNMPDMILGKIYEWVDTTMDKFAIAFGADPGSMDEVPEADLVDTANYLIDMGYDLKGYGFLAKTETKEDVTNNIRKQETYYTFLFINNTNTNHEIHFDGNVVWTSSTSQDNYWTKHIGIGKDENEQAKIIDAARERWLDVDIFRSY